MSRNHTAGAILFLEGEEFQMSSAREAVTYLKRAQTEGVEAVLDVLLDPGPQMCECEIDWVCGLCREAGVTFTYLERRNDYYASLDRDPEEYDDPYAGTGMAWEGDE